MAEHDDMPAAPTTYIFKHFLHSEANLGKLVTREDKYHLHKTLGLLSILSFFYRYGYVYPTTGTLGFDGTPFDWFSMCIHTGLALSSIIFRVPSKRIEDKPMVIYEEYRQHAQVFTLRCFFVFAVATLLPNGPWWVAPVIVMAHHLLADRITSLHGSAGNTAVRATSGRLELSTFYKQVAKGYSFYQFLAIASHILPNARLADLGYNAVIAIQSSAFMMTLYRKRIIRGRTHMAVYAGCLVLSAFHVIRLLGLAISGLVLLAFVLRCNLPRTWSNKYAIWILFMVVVNWHQNGHQLPDIDQLIHNQPLELPTLFGPDTALKALAIAGFVYAAFTAEGMVHHDRTFRSLYTQPRGSKSAAKVKPTESNLKSKPE